MIYYSSHRHLLTHHRHPKIPDEPYDTQRTCTNEHGTRRIRYHWRAKAKATSKAAQQVALQGPRWDSRVLMNTAVKTPRSCQSPRLAAVRKQAHGNVHHWVLGVGRNDSPARYVPLRTQSPAQPSLPSPARTLLTCARHHTSAPFVIKPASTPDPSCFPPLPIDSIFHHSHPRYRLTDCTITATFSPLYMYYHPINCT